MLRKAKLKPVETSSPKASPGSQDWALPFAILCLMLFAVFLVKAQSPGSSEGLKKADQKEITQTPSNSGSKNPLLEKIEKNLREQAQEKFGLSRYPSLWQLQLQQQNLQLELHQHQLFKKGQFEVNGQFLPVLNLIAQNLRNESIQIEVRGHSDPGEGKEVGDDVWQLSLRRSQWIAQYWIREFEIDPMRVVISGVGPFRPLSEEAQDWSQGSNRRMVIIIREAG